MSSINWITTRRALQAWIVSATGLAGDHVIWSGQQDTNGNSVPRPSGPFIELRITLFTAKGFDYKIYDADTSSPPNLTERVRGPRKAVLTIKYFDGIPNNGSEYAPMEAMDNIATGIYLDAIYDAIIAANIGVANIDPAQSTDGVMNTTKVEMRSMMLVHLNLSAELTQTFPQGQGWISEVKASGNSGTDVQPVSVDIVGPS